MGELGWRATALGVLARALAELGRYDEALSCSEQSRDLGARDDVINEIWWRLGRTAALAGLGELAEARRVARETTAITADVESTLFHIEALTMLAAVLHRSG